MANYLVQAAYAPEGIRGVLKNGGTARAEAVRSAIESMGGTLHSFDFAFGDVDVYARVEAPDNVTAAALSLAVSSSGAVSTKVVVLLTPAEIDQAARLQDRVSYTPPRG